MLLLREAFGIFLLLKREKEIANGPANNNKFYEFVPKNSRSDQEGHNQ